MNSLITGQHANFRTMPLSLHHFFLGAIPFQEVFFEMLAEMQNYDELELIVTKIKMIDKGTGQTK